MLDGLSRCLTEELRLRIVYLIGLASRCQEMLFDDTAVVIREAQSIQISECLYFESYTYG